MRIEQSYPSPVFGVSTLAPRTRPQGFMSKQVNFRSDPVNKLTRRPSSLYKGILVSIDNPSKAKFHSYERGGKEFRFITDVDTGLVYCFVDNEFINTVDLGGYSGSNIEMFTVDHATYVLNKDIVVSALSDTDEELIKKVTHINITSALNYGESLQVNITDTYGNRHSISYSVPDLGVTNPDYDTADKARATTQVAAELAARITGGGMHDVKLPNPEFPDDPQSDDDWNKYCVEYKLDEYNNIGVNPNYDISKSVCKPFQGSFFGIAGITAVSLGSTVAIYANDNSDWIQTEIGSGQGDRTSVAINQVIEDTDGLPLYAVVGTRITVRPDPTSDKGVYYLQAERIADNASGEILEEVVWSEDRDPTQPHSFDTTTMPHKIEYIDGSFTFGSVDFRPRKTGNDDSTPFPEFLGKTIETMGYFQKRLVVVAENAVYMTETEDLRNWFRQSAVQLLVSDPVGVTTSELGTDKILHLTPHNRDLLVITSNSQFKINGSNAITPETVSMALTTKYECQVSVEPVSIGNSVYFPVDYGDSTGLQEYTGERNTGQDVASTVTNHVVGLLKGTAKLLTSSPNLEMVAMTTSLSEGNELFVYEQYTDKSGKRQQQSWSIWAVAADEVILDIVFRRNELRIVTAKGPDVIAKTIPLYTRVTTSPLEVYLDDMLILETDGATVTVPTGYSLDGCIVVRGAGTYNELWKAQYTSSGNLVTFKENVGTGTVYVGREFRSEFEPTRPFIYDEDGSTITTDKLRVGKWIVSLVDTHELTMLKTSKFSADTTISFESRFVGQYHLGSIEAYTGDYKFPFSEEANNATASFYVDNYLGCTIADLSWEGQYYKSKQRLT